MTVVIVIFDSPYYINPILNLLYYLQDEGHTVVLIASEVDQLITDELKRRNVRVFLTGSLKNRSRSPRKVWKLIHTGIFRYRVWNIIEHEGLQDSLFWIGSVDTALELGPSLLLRKLRYVLHCHELLDKHQNKISRLKDFAQAAVAVVTPEPTRASILQCWWNLHQPPFVFPNRIHSQIHKSVNQTPEIEKKVEVVSSLRENGKTILLYQGILIPERFDILNITKFAVENNDKYSFVIMCHHNERKILESIPKGCSGVVVLGGVPTPNHLRVTEKADIGIVCYDYSSMNTIFCAPNKIWEYALFGLPMLGNDVPGLVNTVEKSGSGVCVNFSDSNAIKKAIQRIVDQYSTFQKNARTFYESYDSHRTLRRVLEYCDRQ